MDSEREKLNPENAGWKPFPPDIMPPIETFQRVKIGEMHDITGAQDIQIQVSSNGKVIWVNGNDGCILRICQIRGKVEIDDLRKQRT